MLKRSSKKFAIMLVLTMLATMFVGVGTASAASTYTVLSTPTVLNDGSPQNLSTIQIDIPQLEAKDQTLLVTLPTDFEIAYGAGTTPVIDVVKSDASQIAALKGASSIIKVNDREFKIDFAYGAGAFTADSDVRILVTLPNVVVPDSADGDIVATFTNLTGNFSSGSIVVGKAGSGAVDATVISTATITESGSATKAVEINLKENTVGALKISNSSVEIKLPKGFSWVAGGANTSISNITTGGACDPTVVVDSNDDRKLVVKRAAITDKKSIYRIAATVAVDESEAVMGDVEVSVSGTTSVTPSTLIIGSYVDYGVKAVTVSSLPVVKAGQVDQEVADFNIEENAKGSILDGRSINMELPAGAKWHTVNPPTYTGSLTAKTAPTMVGNDGRTLKFSVNNTGGTKGKIKFENVTVMTAVDFSGDLDVTIWGAGLEETTLKLAEVQPAITGEANAENIKIGVQGQNAGTITLKEATKETFINKKDLELELPFGIEWTNVPKVEVTEGDLDIDEDAIGVKGGLLTIRIKSQSTKASTITISDIKLDVNRTVPEGKIKIKVQGDAVDEVNNQNTAGTKVGSFVAPNSDGELFPRNTEAAVVVGANCVTPAPGEEVQAAVFVIGSTTYTMNGITNTMDVAPYIKDARTYMPIRYIANAMGINDNNILWDATSQTVTLMKGDKVVQLKIGSTTIVINGAAVVMDVAPEITNSRTMLPARFVAQAFGANVGWDAATQTVTIN